MKKASKKDVNLLEGNIQRQLIFLAVPLLIGNILQQLYNTADSLIVGHFLGTDAFASVGISGTIMNLFIFVLSGFCVGLSVIFGQLYGRGDQKRFREEVFVAALFGTLLTLVIGGGSMLFVSSMLRLIKTPKELIPYANVYLMVILAGLPFTYFYNLFSGILRSIGDTRAALMFLTVSIVSNVFLDSFFIAGLHMGTGGAAAATVLSQLLSAAGCFFYIRGHYPYLLCRREDFGFHRDLLTRTVRFGVTSALQESSLYIGKILIQGAVNTLGTPGIAAYTATMRLEGFANSFGDSGSQALSVHIAQNLGAGNKGRVYKSFKKAMALQVLLGLSLSVVMFTTASSGIRLFFQADDIRALSYGISYMRLISIVYVLCFIGCTFVGYYRGTGRVHMPFLGTTMQIFFRAFLSRLMVSSFGLAAVAMATGASWALAVSFHAAAYFLHYRKKDLPTASSDAIMFNN